MDESERIAEAIETLASALHQAYVWDLGTKEVNLAGAMAEIGMQLDMFNRTFERIATALEEMAGLE